MVSITIKGLNDVIKDIDYASEALKTSMDDVADLALFKAREYAPVAPMQYSNSGNLQDSIKVRKYKDGFELYCNAFDRNLREYAVFNEYGSVNTPAGRPNVPLKNKTGGGYRPFIRPAVIEATRAYPEIFGKKMYRKS